MYKQLWKLPKLVTAAVFIPEIFGGGIPPPQKKLTIPPNGCQIVCSKLRHCRRRPMYYHATELEGFAVADRRHEDVVVGESADRRERVDERP